jgi:hypothetical protein
MLNVTDVEYGKAVASNRGFIGSASERERARRIVQTKRTPISRATAILIGRRHRLCASGPTGPIVSVRHEPNGRPRLSPHKPNPDTLEIASCKGQDRMRCGSTGAGDRLYDPKSALRFGSNDHDFAARCALIHVEQRMQSALRQLPKQSGWASASCADWRYKAVRAVHDGRQHARFSLCAPLRMTTEEPLLSYTLLQCLNILPRLNILKQGHVGPSH